MEATAKKPARSNRVTMLVRQRIKRGGERLWQFEDFRGLPFSAVAQALSRLTRDGTIERLSKGVYYRNRETAFGKSRPNPAMIQQLAARRKAIFPAGIAAANLLGFTTQTGRQSEVAIQSNSPALTRLFKDLQCALFRASRLPALQGWYGELPPGIPRWPGLRPLPRWCGGRGRRSSAS